MGLTEDEAAALAELEWELSAPHSLQEIAEHIGCNHVTVWRIEKRALRKLQALTSEDWKGPMRDP